MFPPFPLPRYLTLALFASLLLLGVLPSVHSGAIQLTKDNIDSVLTENQFVMINFYADWCRFSNMLAPIWDESADKINLELIGSKVAIAKVDCDDQPELSTKYHVTKYPTIKYILNGQVGKREYRGQRSADSILDFVREQIKNPVQEWNSKDQLLSLLDDKKRHIIGFFTDKSSVNYFNFEKVARSMKDDCDFSAGFSGTVSEDLFGSGDSVTFRPSTSLTNDDDERFSGNLQDYDELSQWVVDKCSALVREITFENAEELTEEGLPFLILFHAPGDTDTIKEYNDLVKAQLLSEKVNFNFLTADGQKFAHPLHHLGKSKDDLPLIAIDSFRHMYLFPKYEDAKIPGRLLQFLNDLHSGKLHREFHYGPDPVNQEEEEEESSEDGNDSSPGDEGNNGEDGAGGAGVEEGAEPQPHIPRDTNNSEDEGDGDSGESRQVRTSSDPPESQFVHLGPSKNRYTILRDEF